LRPITERDDEELVQLGVRIPLRTAQRLKEFCVRNDALMQTFARRALAEKLARARRGTRRQGSRG